MGKTEQFLLPTLVVQVIELAPRKDVPVGMFGIMVRQRLPEGGLDFGKQRGQLGRRREVLGIQPLGDLVEVHTERSDRWKLAGSMANGPRRVRGRHNAEGCVPGIVAQRRPARVARSRSRTASASVSRKSPLVPHLCLSWPCHVCSSVCSQSAACFGSGQFCPRVCPAVSPGKSISALAGIECFRHTKTQLATRVLSRVGFYQLSSPLSLIALRSKFRAKMEYRQIIRNLEQQCHG